MHEVPTSRRAVMRAIAIVPAIIAAPAVAAAAPALVCAAAEDPAWLVLLAEEQRAYAAYSAAIDLSEEAANRFHEAIEAFDCNWWDRFEARRFPAVPKIDGETDAQHEERVNQAVQQWNADGAAFRQEKEETPARLRAAAGCPEADEAQAAACEAHRTAIDAVIAHPSRSPDIIARKLQLIVREFGDCDHILDPLLTSIDAEVA